MNILACQEYTCQLSCLRCVSQACGLKTSISHQFTFAAQILTPDWLIINVRCFRLARHNYQKYVSSDRCKKWKLCVKWINDVVFLTISDFWNEKHWEWCLWLLNNYINSSQKLLLIHFVKSWIKLVILWRFKINDSDILPCCECDSYTRLSRTQFPPLHTCAGGVWHWTFTGSI